MFERKRNAIKDSPTTAQWLAVMVPDLDDASAAGGLAILAVVALRLQSVQLQQTTSATP